MMVSGAVRPRGRGKMSFEYLRYADPKVGVAFSSFCSNGGSAVLVVFDPRRLTFFQP
jgi:hypothetical protein